MFEVIPPKLTQDLVQEHLKLMSGLVVSSDAFFPFSDNIERVCASGVETVAAPSGSVMDSAVVEVCEERKVSMVFTDWRLFHH